MRPFLLGSIALATLTAATPAFSQGVDWTGPYFGGRLGYTSQPKDNGETILFDANLDGDFNDSVQTAAGADAFQRGFCGGAALSANTTNCQDKDGTEWAVHAGYDLQFGSAIVVGIVGEYGRAYIEDSVSAFSSTPAFYTLTRRLGDTAALRARAGVTLGNSLAYATGGVAYGKIRSSFTTSNQVNSFTPSGDNEEAWGYRAGGGLEHRFSGGFSLGVQYLYTSLKDDDFRLRVAGDNVPVSNPFILQNGQGTDFRRSGSRFTSHNVSVVASFRF